jgi:hypothetical protein
VVGKIQEVGMEEVLVAILDPVQMFQIHVLAMPSQARQALATFLIESK